MADGTMGTFPDDAPFHYAANGNSLVREGTVWPPILRDDGSRDSTELFEAIAEGLNNLGANRAILKHLRKTTADYKSGKITATEVTDIVLRLIAVAKDIQVG
jgi:hypothetical protein